MSLTPNERRQRIDQLAQADAEYRKMRSEYDLAKQRFTKLTDHLPRKLRNLLWSCPGMFYLMHHRMLTLICQNMKFYDEE